MSTYKSYQFIDKDPIIDYIRTVMNDSHLSIKRIADESGVGYNTIVKWIYGDTMRPQAASMNAVLRVCNYKLSINKIDMPEIIYPTPFTPRPVKPETIKPKIIKPNIYLKHDKEMPKWQRYQKIKDKKHKK